ncbi:hypothetical protein ACLOJK_018811 [Asimina triloba]
MQAMEVKSNLPALMEETTVSDAETSFNLSIAKHNEQVVYWHWNQSNGRNTVISLGVLEQLPALYQQGQKNICFSWQVKVSLLDLFSTRSEPVEFGVYSGSGQGIPLLETGTGTGTFRGDSMGGFPGEIQKDLPDLDDLPTPNRDRERVEVLRISTWPTPLATLAMTLLDPFYLSGSLDKPLTAVTYSLSRLSEILATIKTARLTRNSEADRKKMDELLRKGDLVVCPEGTTCREPYLLRFSPLFAELTDEIVPVALVDIYHVKVLEKVPKEFTCGGGDGITRIDMANSVQRELGKALGFECTELTRKDKYLMLAGNEFIVPNLK